MKNNDKKMLREISNDILTPKKHDFKVENDLYAQIDLKVIQGKDSGFIKFGSRVDIFLPLNSNINVKKGQRVIGGITVLSSKH